MGLHIPKRARRLLAGGGLVTAMLLLSGCDEESTGQIKRLAMPIPATIVTVGRVAPTMTAAFSSALRTLGRCEGTSPPTLDRRWASSAAPSFMEATTSAAVVRSS